MGHVSFQKLKYMSVLKGFEINKDVCSMPCDICPCAKQHRLPFHNNYISSARPFDLDDVDTGGPYHAKTNTGRRYFLTLVDD